MNNILETNLKQIPYIYEVNAIYSTFAKELGYWIWLIAQDFFKQHFE